MDAPVDIIRMNKTCKACSGAKIRCIVGDGHEKCNHCLKKAIDCVFEPRKRKEEGSDEERRTRRKKKAVLDATVLSLLARTWLTDLPREKKIAVTTTFLAEFNDGPMVAIIRDLCASDLDPGTISRFIGSVV